MLGCLFGGGCLARAAEEEGAPASGAPEAGAPEAGAAGAEKGTRIEIQALRTAEAEPSPAFPKKHLGVEVEFQLVGPEAEALAASRTPFHVYVHGVDVESEDVVPVALLSDRLDPQGRKYVCRIECPLPPLGSYDLYAAACLLPEDEPGAAYRGHRLHIVA